MGEECLIALLHGDSKSFEARAGARLVAEFFGDVKKALTGGG